MRALTALLSVIAVAATVAGCDHVDEMTPRSYVGLVVGHSAPLKVEVAKALVANAGAAVPQAGILRLEPLPGVAPMKVDFGWVTRGGVIIIQSKDHAVTVVQEPVLEKDKGAVTWLCVVHPSEAKPALCGSDYQNSQLQKR